MFNTLVCEFFVWSRLIFCYLSSALFLFCFIWNFPDIPLKCDEANGWVSAGGKCHRYQNWDSTWDDARRYCQTLGGDLISIQTDEEQNVARLQVQANFQSIWIGASDKVRIFVLIESYRFQLFLWFSFRHFWIPRYNSNNNNNNNDK